MERAAPGTLGPALEPFLESYWQRYATLIVCGGSDDVFDAFFESLLRLCPPNLFTVVISDVEAAPSLAVIRPTQREMNAEDSFQGATAA